MGYDGRRDKSICRGRVKEEEERTEAEEGAPLSPVTASLAPWQPRALMPATREHSKHR